MTDPTARIEAALSHLGSEHEPPAGWEKRVMAATSTPARRHWWPYWTAALALGCAILAFRIIPAGNARPDPLEIAVSYEKPKNVVATLADPTRKGTPELGDVMRAVAQGGPYRALWLYRDNHLVAACPGAASCESTRDTTILRFKLDAIGEYRVFAFSSPVPLAPPRGTLDVDVDNATAAGAQYKPEVASVH